MHKTWEIAVTAAIFVLIVVPVSAGIYVGMTSTKTDHHGSKPSKYAEAAHVAGIQPAAGDEGHADHGEPGVAEGHASAPGTTAETPMAPDHAAPTQPLPCPFQELVGHKVDDSVHEQLRAAHKLYRVLKPGSVMTMDFSAERVNLNVDDHDVITSVTCG